jgi:hypothetical protein
MKHKEREQEIRKGKYLELISIFKWQWLVLPCQSFPINILGRLNSPIKK